MGRTRLVDRLHQLYPHLTRQSIENKINPDDLDEQPSKFSFFRAFVPYFYDLLRKEGILKGKKIAKKKFRCWCVGDPHLDNFGVLAQLRTGKKKQTFFTMNDPDDGGRGDPAADLLRFMTSIRLAKKKRIKHGKPIKKRLEQVMRLYRQGLESDRWPTRRKGVLKLLKDRDVKKKTRNDIRDKMIEGCTPKTDFYEKRNGKKRLVSKDLHTSNYCIPQKIRKRLRDLLQQEYGQRYKKKLRDLIPYSKQNGGSGGLLQYRVLMKRKKNTKQKWPKWLVLDIKPEMRPGLYAWYKTALQPRKSTSMDPELIRKRTRKSLRIERGNNSDYFTRSVVIDQMGPYLLRPRWQGQFNLSAREIKNDVHLMHAEAWVLGRIHRKTIAKPKAYRKAIRSKRNKLLANSRTMSDLMKQKYGIVS
ncbi:MAG: DUF2252 family protein [Magnetococcales bacterium]|nr:DUF2252 family protein [Magnetococcales bacterium]